MRNVGSLSVVKQLNIYRVRAALAVFKMMDLDAQLPERKANREDIQKVNRKEDGKPIELLLTGCSSILSIPVPNSGNYSGEDCHSHVRAVYVHN